MLSQSARLVLLDASPLCRFAECDLLLQLRAYFGPRARITREVERELVRLGARAEFAELAEHLADDSETVRSEGKWPKATANLPDALKVEFANIHSLKRAVDEHDKAHAGEIATVLMAQHRGADLVISDDVWGSNLAKARGLAVMSTARLSLEMVVAGGLSASQGFRVFDAATLEDVGRDRFDQAMARLRRAANP